MLSVLVTGSVEEMRLAQQLSGKLQPKKILIYTQLVVHCELLYNNHTVNADLYC